MNTETTPPAQPEAVLSSAELGAGDLRQLWQQDWEPTEQDRKAGDLAKRYHDEAEAYDRTVCTGPIRDGSIQPANASELANINRHAHQLKRQIILEATAAGISEGDMRRAITHFGIHHT